LQTGGRRRKSKLEMCGFVPPKRRRKRGNKGEENRGTGGNHPRGKCEKNSKRSMRTRVISLAINLEKFGT